jgi:hypothetical protein
MTQSDLPPIAPARNGHTRRRQMSFNAWPITFHLLTERSKAILISVTKGWLMSKPTDLVQELEKEAANWNRLSAAISRVVKLKEA